jgi:hypothetical protein
MQHSPRRALARPFRFERIRPGPHWLTCSLAGALLAGCESDFEPYGELSSLRVLAIGSTPAALAPGETALLEPLLYVPGDEPVTSSWSWCPVEALDDEGLSCPLDEAQASLALGATVTYDLGNAAVARFEHAFDPASLARFCSGAALAAASLGALDCSEGLPVQIHHRVSSASDAVESVRRLRLRFSPEQPVNENPALDGISALVAGTSLALDDAGSVLLPRETEVELQATLAESASEPLPVALGERSHERLVLSWFIEAGETRYERTSFAGAALPVERALRNTWTLPSLAEQGAAEARLIVVVRDERGGVGWRSARVTLGAAP